MKILVGMWGMRLFKKPASKCLSKNWTHGWLDAEVSTSCANAAVSLRFDRCGYFLGRTAPGTKRHNRLSFLLLFLLPIMFSDLAFEFLVGVESEQSLAPWKGIEQRIQKSKLHFSSEHLARSWTSCTRAGLEHRGHLRIDSPSLHFCASWNQHNTGS